MSLFDKLSLEIVTRPSISPDERLGLAELQLQRARRMHLLMIGDDADNTSETVRGLIAVRDEALGVLVAKRKLKAEEELEKLAKAYVTDQQEEERPALADTAQRTASRSTTPAARDEAAPNPAASGQQFQPAGTGMRRRPDWATIYARLPIDRSPAHAARRAKLFHDFDPNGNGYLSLAEIDKGVRDVLCLEDLFDAKPVLIRAYNAARALSPSPGQGQDFVEKSEFRMLLVYLYNYMKIWEVFASADESDDRRLDKEEFAKTYGALKRWAPELTLDQAWNAIKPPNQSQILFTEFAEWAIQKQLKTLVEDPTAE